MNDVKTIIAGNRLRKDQVAKGLAVALTNLIANPGDPETTVKGHNALAVYTELLAQNPIS